MNLPFTKIIVSFDDRGSWHAKISEVYHAFDNMEPHHITFSFDSRIALGQIEPVHLVTFACLIQYLIDKGHAVFMDTSNLHLHEYIFNELNFAEYWGGGKNHVDARTSDNILICGALLIPKKICMPRKSRTILTVRISAIRI